MTNDSLRSRFTDYEWELYQRGKCCWVVAYGLPWTVHCEKPSSRLSPFGYCEEHIDEQEG